MNTPLQQEDPQTYDLIQGEKKRQKEGLEMIPSENYVSPAILEALGSVFTNKYSEGYPGLRYYGGQEFTDRLESLAIERAKKLFRSDHANVQPLSGSPMNQAVYLALLQPGDCIMGMDLSHGGHLTHGHPVSHMGKLFNWVRYKTHPEEQGRIDFDELLALAKEHRPKVILCGYTSYPRDLDYAGFKRVADEVGAFTMADVAHIGGLIAADVMRNPFDYGFDIVTTTTHKTLRGPRGGMILTKGKVGNPLKAVELTRENLPTVIDRSVFPGLQGGPHMNTIAAIAVMLQEAMQPEFKEYAQQVLKNAKALAAELMAQGAELVTGGTDNHMMVIDSVASFELGGAELEKLLDSVGITTNKSMIPDDPRPPFNPSGVRLGTPAMTTRGVKEDGARRIAGWIIQAVQARTDSVKLAEIRAQVKEFSLAYPVPGIPS
ncbi:MAG: serine hydroxymethyltransferase [Candidatus Liptonbacteria bacterium]|nr:serine hydroxymethyltransferase [Candidatus Liptonbacteria bacterium]